MKLLYNQSGFTFIELVIATGILTILITSIALILQSSLSSIGNARVRTTASKLATEYVELVRKLTI